jgi:M6 family metalloprotease-like protein
LFPKCLFIIYVILFTNLFAQQHLEVYALRVEFQEDNNTLTTGNGHFMPEGTTGDPYTIDPPPHDVKYFKDQVIAVNNYFLAASTGKFRVTGKIFPLQNDLTYRLNRPMGYYNPNTSEEENNWRLAQLFIHAVTCADTSGDTSIFSGFNPDSNLVVIFHAGVGRDVNLGYDSTPQDIPSLYLSPDFFHSVGEEGAYVNDSLLLIDRGIILPETESQDDVQLALTGIFAANIGSHLGLYDLFSPSTQNSGIARFGLMDMGLFNMNGLAPAYPCAYSRALIGWDAPVLLDEPQNNVIVNRFQGEETEGTSSYKIPLHSDEYFLIEYRGDRKVNIDSLYAVLSENSEREPSYREVLETYFAGSIEVSDSTGVVLKVNNYDWGLPGAGILIWHIDQAVINAKKDLNCINDDPENRGVDLEEADGSQDIGKNYSLLEPGYQSEFGTWLDFWFKGQNDEEYRPLYKNEFSDNSSPDTKSNRNNASSHIIMKNFSGNTQPYMTFDYTRDYFLPGFPITLTEDTTDKQFSAPVIVQVEGFNQNCIFTSDQSGNIYAVADSGKGLIDQDNLILEKFGNGELPYLSFADTNHNDQPEVLVAAGRSGRLEVFQITADTVSEIFSFQTLNERFTTPAVIQNPYIYIAKENGDILRFLINGDGSSYSTYHFQNNISGFTVISPAELEVSYAEENKPAIPPVLVYLDNNDLLDRISFPSFEQLAIRLNDEEKIINLSGRISGIPAIFDLDGDGFYEIIINLQDKIVAYNYNGTIVTDISIKPVLQLSEILIGTPLIFDADHDGYADIITSSSSGQIFTFNNKGKLLSDFSVSAGGIVSNSCVAGDLNNDHYLELFLVNNTAHVYGWQLAAMKDGNDGWYQSAYDFTNNAYIEQRLPPVGLTVADLLPRSRLYNYPNPNKDNVTFIRYYLKEDAEIHIRIFDLAGDLVKTFRKRGKGMEDDEISWDLSDVASGIYLCRVEAKSARETDVKFIKIMVVH